MRIWKANAWFEKPLEAKLIPNADLWKEVDRRLHARVKPFAIGWTKGHPLPMHLSAQQTTELDAYGNVGADFLAGVASDPTERRIHDLAQVQLLANHPLPKPHSGIEESP